MTAPAEDRLYDKAELAEWLGVPESWVRDAITARRIPITWVGRHARFSVKDRAQIVADGKEPTPKVDELANYRRSTKSSTRSRQRRSA